MPTWCRWSGWPPLGLIVALWRLGTTWRLEVRSRPGAYWEILFSRSPILVYLLLIFLRNAQRQVLYEPDYSRWTSLTTCYSGKTRPSTPTNPFRPLKMPTGSLSNYNLWQLGPLTTTFAAPASCVTATDYRSIADVDFPGTDILKEACEERQWGECLPSGSALDTHFSHAISSSTRGFYMPYFYPGLHCPSGWSTAGVAEKSGVGTAPSLSGIFTGTSFHQPGVSTTRSVPFINPMPNILLEALHAGETAILCCPTYVFDLTTFLPLYLRWPS